MEQATRLERAVSVFLGWQSRTERESARELLAAHPDLAEYLEPMLEDAEDGGGAEAAEKVVRPEIRKLGDYRIVRELGRGGMGVVFEAWQMSLGRRVALKVLAPHLTHHPTTLARFRREATTAARLKHPGIVSVLEFGTDGDTHFIAMELIEGAPLDRVLRQLRDEQRDTIHGRSILGAITDVLSRERSDEAAQAPAQSGDARRFEAAWNKSYVEMIVNIAAQVADTLEFAHSEGVIHRDIKPSNILVRPDGNAVLTDFGLAREEAQPSLTVTGDFAGSPYYVSPEQAMAKRVRVDHRSDLFSLGTTLFELITHRRPFEGDSAAEILGQIVQREAPDPQKFNPALAPDLGAIVLKALEKDPRRRYQTAAAMADDLRAFLEYRPVQARRPTAGMRLRRWVRREPWKAALGTAAVAVVGLGVYVLATQGATIAGREALHQQRVRDLLQKAYGQAFLGGPKESLPLFEEVLRIDPGNPFAIVGVAKSGSGRAAVDDPLAFLERHRVAGRADVPLDRVRAVLLRAAGKPDAADALAATLGPPTDELDCFIAGLAALPPPAHEESEFEESLRLFRSAVFRSREANLLHYLQLSYVASRIGNDELSVECANALLELWPDDPGALLAAGVALRFVDPERARQALERAAELAPTSPIVARNLAGVYRVLGNLPAAIDKMRHATELDPKGALAFSVLAAYLTSSGDYPAAIESARRAIELDPRSANHYHALAAAQERNGDRPAALLTAYRAIELDPRFPRAHRGILGLCRLDENWAAMRTEHERWLGLFPDDPRAHAALAGFLVDHGDGDADIARARQAAERAVELSSERDARFLVTLARAAAASGDTAAATAALDKARAALPADPEQRAALLGQIEELGG